MKPLSQRPVQPEPREVSPARPGTLPTWAELPPSRQQEVITLLASLVLRYWASQRAAGAEVHHDHQS
jgi:hypothetical protein